MIKKEKIYLEANNLYSPSYGNIDYDSDKDTVTLRLSSSWEHAEHFKTIEEAEEAAKKNGYHVVAKYSENPFMGKRFYGRTGTKGTWVLWDYFADVKTTFKSGVKKVKRFDNFDKALAYFYSRIKQRNVKMCYAVEGFHYEEPKQNINGIIHYGTSYTTIITDPNDYPCFYTANE